MGILRAYRGILGDIPISLSALRRISKTVVLKSFNRADYRRWTNPASFESWWETRTQKVAALIPRGSRVIEFGAGSRWLKGIVKNYSKASARDVTIVVKFLDKKKKVLGTQRVSVGDLASGGQSSWSLAVQERNRPATSYQFEVHAIWQ